MTASEHENTAHARQGRPVPPSGVVVGWDAISEFSGVSRSTLIRSENDLDSFWGPLIRRIDGRPALVVSEFEKALEDNHDGRDSL